MRTEIALRRRDSGMTRLRDIMSGARSFGSTSAETETKRRDMLESTCKGAPAWVRAYLDGYWRAVIDHAYSSEFVFGGFVNGQFYSTHHNRTDYYETSGIEPSAYADDGAVVGRGHYWARHVDAGKPRAWFVDGVAS